jgi:hypothetical protein
MKTFVVYEPAMCCPTGICGVSVDPELLRMSSVIQQLEKAGIKTERFNLSSDPLAFIKNSEVNKLLMSKGIEVLPVTLIQGEIIETGRYLSNAELEEKLDVKLTMPASAASGKRPLRGFRLKNVSVCDPNSGCF